MAGQRKERMGEIDALKGIGAVVIALLFHYKDFWAPGEANPMFGIPVLWHLVAQGKWFVELFFMLSGFMLYRGYKRKIMEAGGGTRFFIKRFVRILPVMVLAVLAAWALQWTIKWITGSVWLGSNASLDIWHLFYALLGLQHLLDTAANIIPASWFIGPLFACYFLFWFFTKYAVKRDNGWVIYMVPFAVGIMLSSVDWMGHPLINQSMGRGLLNFFLGVLLCVAMDAIESGKGPSERTVTGAVLCLCAILTATYGLNRWECRALQIEMNFVGDYRLVYTFVIFPVLIWLSIKWKPLNKLLNIRCLGFLGQISFSMYMWHQPLYYLIHLVQLKSGFPQDTTTMTFFCTVAALLIAVSTLSFYLLEKPTQKYLYRKLCPK